MFKIIQIIKYLLIELQLLASDKGSNNAKIKKKIK